MSTLREQIIVAALARLNTGAPGGVPAAIRTGLHPLDASTDLPSIMLRPLREEVTPFDGNRFNYMVNRQLTLRVEIRGQGEPVDQALDPLCVWVSQALSGQQFDGLANDTIESATEWEYSDLDAQMAMATVDFTIWYNTSRTDASQPT